MVQNYEIKFQLFASGYCEAHNNIVNPKFGKGKVKFYAVWALLNIPDVGYVLFDSGYTDQFQKATHKFPGRFYRWATPVVIKADETAVAILEKKGIAENKIKYVIISHFHADHIAGLKSFTSATFICSSDSLEEVKKLRGIRAVRKAILHDLLPEDFYQRVVTIESFADKIIQSSEGFEAYYLFKNEQFFLIAVPGHAKGMLGFILNTKDQKILYGSDASWSYETYSEGILPRKIVKLFFDSWSDFIQSNKKIKCFEKENPAFSILFTHCEKTLQYIQNEI
jgi:glyoxylase-like metal-dependent hydrolase (beta-lactamase superfamily II)